MRNFVFAAFMSLLFIVSCKKNSDSLTEKNYDPVYLQNVQSALADSLTIADFNNLNFEKATLAKKDSAHLYLLRIPLKIKTAATEFLLVQTDLQGKIKTGKIIQLNESIGEQKQSDLQPRKWNGSIIITSLDKKNTFSSKIINGYFEALHDPNAKLQPYPDPYIELPEVVVVSSYSSGGGGISWSSWISLTSMLGTYSPYYMSYGGGYGSGSEGGNSGGGGGASYGGGGSSTNPEELITIDFENQAADPAIQIANYMKCFTNIPDAGATGSIEIFTDIPVDGKPDLIFDWEAGSPGHTFIQLKKQNGSKSVTQNIGFYPKVGWKAAVTSMPVDGKFVDNKLHEFNASYKVNLTSDQIKKAVSQILYLSNFVEYDLDSYNCTHWALDVFNATVKVDHQLNYIPLVRVPGCEDPKGTKTPQGLYKKLQEMNERGIPGVSVPLSGAVGLSSGPCN